MKCPVCNAVVATVRSAVDGATIRLCSNQACGWEELPEAVNPEAENQYFNKAHARLPLSQREPA